MSYYKELMKHFSKIQSYPNKKLDIFKCNYCTQEYAFHTTRMSKHLINCKGSSDRVKNIFNEKFRKKNRDFAEEKRKREDSSTEEFVDISESSNENTEQRQPLKVNIFKTMTSFVDKLDFNQEQHIHKLLARAMYISGSPLSMLDNIYWKDAFKACKPALSLPSRHDLSNKLLDNEYADVENKVTSKIDNATSVAIQCDAWSNIRNEGIINFIINTPDPVFYKSISVGTSSQNGEYLKLKISEVIEDVGVNKVAAVCTDNAAVCKKAWRLLSAQFDGHMIAFYGCVAHILNLLARDICELTSAADILSKTSVIINDVKRSHVLSAAFKEIQLKDESIEKVTTTLKLAVSTRWSSQLTSLKSIFHNKQNLKYLAISEYNEKLHKSTHDILLDEEFWVRTSKLIEILKPIADWLKKIEGDESKVSEIVLIFQDLNIYFEKQLTGSLSLFTQEETVKIFKQLKIRKNMALHPVHYAANILNPKFKGQSLSVEDFSSGSAYISKLSQKFGLKNSDVLVDLLNYNSGSGLWGTLFVLESLKLVSAITWWKGACKCSALSKIAIAILQLPCTSAATERSFSTHGWIHSSIRNKLSIERAAKIAYISYNVKLFDRPLKNLQRTVSVTDDELSDTDENVFQRYTFDE